MKWRTCIFSVGGLLCFCASISAFAAEKSVSAKCMGFSSVPTQVLRERDLDAKAKLRFIPVGKSAYLVQVDASCGMTGRCDSDFFVSDEEGCFRNVLSVHAKWLGSDGKAARTPATLRFQGDIEQGILHFRYEERTQDYQLEPKKASRG